MQLGRTHKPGLGEVAEKAIEIDKIIAEAKELSDELVATVSMLDLIVQARSRKMEIDPTAREQLIEFARSQMTRRGEIDTIIFTTEDIMAGLKKGSEKLDKVVADADQALRPVEEDAEND